MGRYAVMLSACAGVAACMQEAPLTDVGELEPVCEGTQEGRACITLVPGMTDHVREQLAGETEGAVSWGLWEGGKVGPLGPEDQEGYLIAGEYIVDLDGDDPDARSVTIVDFEPGWFHALAYFRPLPIEEPGDGDALTLPTSGFEAAENAHTRVEIIFNHVR